MSAVEQIMPRKPRPEVAIDLPFPPSVNRIWRRTGRSKPGMKGIYKSPQYIKWQLQCHKLLSYHRKTMSDFKAAGGTITLPFEATILLNSEAGWGDVDNRIKSVMDYAQLIEIVKNDKLCMKITAEWVIASLAPFGCRLIIKEL